jgi:hypothetical protein
MEVGQNYPNPFNQQTVIDYRLTTESPVDLTIYTITGQVVMSRHLDAAGEGQHQFTVSSSDLNPGVYFYTLTAQGQTVTKKMIIQ